MFPRLPGRQHHFRAPVSGECGEGRVVSSLAKEVMEAISCQLIPRVSDLLDPDFKSRMDLIGE